MNSNAFVDGVIKSLKANAPEILTGLGVIGVAATSYLTARATFVAADLLSSEPEDISTKEKIKHTWRLYIPAAISGVVSSACIIGASHGSHRRTAAAVTAYSLSEKAFSEYKEKVVEQIGKNKEQKVRDDIAQKKVLENPPPSSGVIVIGNGNVLCCELYSHRYFRSDMETLRKAENDINYSIISSRYVRLDDFYAIIGLPPTEFSSNLGWEETEGLLTLEFSAVLSEDSEPCLAFKYNYLKPIGI